MAGNAMEWVADWYDAGYFSVSPRENPTGPAGGSQRVLRGGSYNGHFSYLRASDRYAAASAADLYYSIGFRCAVSADEIEQSMDAVSQPATTPSPTPTPTPTPTPLAGQVPEAGSTQVSSQDGMEMVYIPAGTFLMGSEDGEEDEQPIHEVHLDAYWIDRTEVTNAMFAAFLNEEGNQSQEGTSWLDSADTDVRIHQVEGEWMADSNFEQHPVTEVTWYGAAAYCQWVGRRLPTEAEWERAARGEEGFVYPHGNTAPTCNQANYRGCVGYTTIVGSHLGGASPYGVLDMAGNVFEWVSDWYGGDYYQESPHENPSGPSSGGMRVQRGGSWYSTLFVLRTTNRSNSDPGDSQGSLGFRCAQTAQ
jgi:formylglycine-generating enzyme required for sulfatase activity